MGSEAFPKENEYDSFLQSHGGSSNAWTDAEQTVFHGDVHPASLRGALERFASQFVAPLCVGSAAEREMRAVDAEFAAACQADGARLQQVQAAAAPRGHPGGRFSWGDARSLKHVARARLLEHWGEHYRAHRCTLALLGGESLDTLASWVAELFGGVPAGGPPPPSFAGAGCALQCSAATLTRAAAVKEAHELVITVSLPPLGGAYLCKPDEYAAHVLGHEGRGSLLSLLKARGWATGLSAGVSDGGHERSTASWHFCVQVTLTEAGLASWADVAAAVFAAARASAAAGPCRRVWDELASVRLLEWRFAEEEDGAEYCARLAAGAHRYAPHHAAAGEALMTNYDAAAIAGVLARLADPSNARVDLQSSAFRTSGSASEALQPGDDALRSHPLAAPASPGGPAGVVRTEAWMGVEHGVVSIPPSLLAAWATRPIPAELTLPEPNAFIPSDFELRPPLVAGGGVAASASASAAHRAAATAAAAVAAASPPPGAGGGGAGGGGGSGSLGSPGAGSPSAGPPAPPSRLRLPLRPAPTRAPQQRLRLWHKLDGLGGRFGSPRAVALFAISLPLRRCGVHGHAPGSPGDEAMASLACRVAEDALTEVSYAADVAGLRCSLLCDAPRIELRVEGFAHKLPQLVAACFAVLLSPPRDGGCGGGGEGAAAAAAEAAARAASLPSSAPPAGSAPDEFLAYCPPSDPGRLARCGEAARRSLRNALLRPAKHASYLRLRSLRANATRLDAQLASLEAADGAALGAFVTAAAAGACVDCLVVGNVSVDEAAALGATVERALAAAAVEEAPVEQEAGGGGGGSGGGGGAPRLSSSSPAASPTARSRRVSPPALLVGGPASGGAAPQDFPPSLPGADGSATTREGVLHAAHTLVEPVLRVAAPGAVVFDVCVNAADDNSAVEVLFQADAGGACAGPRERALADLAAAMLSEPVFDSLRTREQLGYSVGSGPRNTHGVVGFVVSVTSSSHGPAHLLARIDALLDAYVTSVRSTAPAAFEAHRSAAVAAKRCVDKSLAEEADRHWDALWHRRPTFGDREAEAVALEGLTLADVAAWMEATLLPRSPTRRALRVAVASSSRAAAERASLAGAAAAAGQLFVEGEAGCEALHAAWGFFNPQPDCVPS